MDYIDLHCDTLTKAIKRQVSVYDGEGLVSPVNTLINAGAVGQVFAIYFPPHPADIRNMEQMQSFDEDFYEKAVCAYQRLVTDLALHTDSRGEVSDAASLFRPVLSIEDARFLYNRLDRIDGLAEDGVALATLLWNAENCIGYPNSTDGSIMQRGLKPFGHEAVLRLWEKKILVDVSHLSDGGFWDVLSLAKQCSMPVIASHSNARALREHPRNLTDEMIRALAQSGGVCGVCYYPLFLSETASNVQTVAEHICHMLRVGGEDLPALGSDFDGFSGTPAIPDPMHLRYLEQALCHKGLPERIIEKIFLKNARRVLYI